MQSGPSSHRRGDLGQKPSAALLEAVVVSDLKKETADEVASGIAANGGRVIGVACDVTNGDARKALVAAAVAQFGQINLLVNNAGGGGPKPFDMPMDTFVWAFELNVFAVFHLAQLYCPSL